MMVKLDKLTERTSDAAALVLTAAAVGVFIVTVSARLIEVRAGAVQQHDFQITMQTEEPPAPPTPPAPRPPVKQKVLQRPVLPVAPQPVDPTPIEPAPMFTAAEVPTVPAPAPASEPAAVADPDVDAQYAALLRADIDRRTSPPDSARYRLRHPSGEVKVLFVVTRAGEPRAVRVLNSSGSGILDDAALNIVSSGHYAPMPAKAFVGEAQHTFLVTIEFRPAQRTLL
jgi:TonB family protein